MPEEIDTKFLAGFRKLISAQAKKGQRFVISPGGGKTCRRYQAALSSVIKASGDDLDWIGLNTNRFHAVLLRLMFKNLAEKDIAYDPNKRVSFSKKILIGGGGWKPGRSSDDYSVRLAKIYNADTVINLTDVDYAYDKNPKKFKNAKKVKKSSWKDFYKVIGTKWNPGANVPFDPTAGKFAQKNKIKVIIANGRNLKNLENILSGKPFQGTIVS